LWSAHLARTMLLAGGLVIAWNVTNYMLTSYVPTYLTETLPASGEHGISEEDQEAYLNKIVKRIGNPHLEDAVERVGRAPLRKLSRKERFVGPAAELAENDQPISHLLDAIEMAFRFQNVEDDEESKELAKIMSEDKPADVVQKVCGIQDSEKIFSQLVKVVQRVQEDSRED